MLEYFSRHICGQSGFNEEHPSLGPISIEYDTLLLLIEHLKAAAEIASSRTKNWQKYCLRNKSKYNELLHNSAKYTLVII